MPSSWPICSAPTAIASGPCSRHPMTPEPCAPSSAGATISSPSAWPWPTSSAPSSSASGPAPPASLPTSTPRSPSRSSPATPPPTARRGWANSGSPPPARAGRGRPAPPSPRHHARPHFPRAPNKAPPAAPPPFSHHPPPRLCLGRRRLPARARARLRPSPRYSHPRSSLGARALAVLAEPHRVRPQPPRRRCRPRSGVGLTQDVSRGDLHARDRHRGDALSTSEEPEPLGTLGLYAHPIDVEPERLGQPLGHPVEVRREPWRLGEHRRVDVDEPPAA